MIYYDQLVFRLIGLDGSGDPIGGETFDVPAPCEVWPLTSVETDKGATTYTVYRVATPYDLSTLPSLEPVEWTADSVRVDIIYRGQALTVSAGYERHAVSGRLDHYEFVVEDFDHPI